MNILVFDMGLNEKSFLVHGRRVCLRHLAHADGGLHRIRHYISWKHTLLHKIFKRAVDVHGSGVKGIDRSKKAEQKIAVRPPLKIRSQLTCLNEITTTSGRPLII